ncbi:response regulator transcription factor [Sphingomonas sp. ABOLG]|uniref:response regulator transcription factor n=1 Tax=Sphingomonas sp. ABOLG TaxID=1985880 RepID=UPI001F49FC84|nr:response regulator transcription factor [Sphingomonas sp. ABOLG]
MPAKVLVVDDDAAIRRLLRNTLLRADYEIVEAENAKVALRQVAAEHPAAILLDLGLPDRDGLSIIPQLRAHGDLVILVVSARDAVDEKVAALDLGADDFVTKPFDTEELLARLRVALRHQQSSGTIQKIVSRGDLSIDLDRRIVCRHGKEVHLTRKEYEVLGVLAEHIGRGRDQGPCGRRGVGGGGGAGGRFPRDRRTDSRPEAGGARAGRRRHRE